MSAWGRKRAGVADKSAVGTLKRPLLNCDEQRGKAERQEGETSGQEAGRYELRPYDFQLRRIRLFLSLGRLHPFHNFFGRDRHLVDLNAESFERVFHRACYRSRGYHDIRADTEPTWMRQPVPLQNSAHGL